MSSWGYTRVAFRGTESDIKCLATATEGEDLLARPGTVVPFSLNALCPIPQAIASTEDEKARRERHWGTVGEVHLQSYEWYKSRVDVLLTWTCAPPILALLKVAQDYRLDISLDNLPPPESQEFFDRNYDKDLEAYDVVRRHFFQPAMDAPMLGHYALSARKNSYGYFAGTVKRIISRTAWNGTQEEYIVMEDLYDKEFDISVFRAGFRRTKEFHGSGDLKPGDWVGVCCSFEDVDYRTWDGHQINCELYWPFAARREGVSSLQEVGVSSLQEILDFWEVVFEHGMNLAREDLP